MVYSENKFERLISLAAMDCGNDEVEAFDNLDTSDVVFSNRFQRIKYKIIRKYNYPKQHTVTIKVFWRILIALMVVMSIGFMTIMAVEPLREALFKAVITQYDDHFTISFKPEGEVPVTTQEETSKTEETTIEESSENAPGYVVDEATDSNTTTEYINTDELVTEETTTDCSTTELITTSESTTEEVSTAPIKPNDIIKEVRKPTWIPDGMEEVEGVNTKLLVSVDYYVRDEYYFTYMQQPIAIGDTYVDNEGAIITEININGYSGILATYSGEDRLNLIWSDNEYIYYICGELISLEESLKIAESIIN